MNGRCDRFIQLPFIQDSPNSHEWSCRAFNGSKPNLLPKRVKVWTGSSILLQFFSREFGFWRKFCTNLALTAIEKRKNIENLDDRVLLGSIKVVGIVAE